MTQKNPYGAFYAKLNYMEWTKQGNDFLRQVIFHYLEAKKRMDIQMLRNYSLIS